MQKAPKISIVTSSYNQGKYLERTICSILDQGYPNLEYVIIDGGSQDDSISIIKKYSKKLAYWVSEPDKGQSDALNKGFSKTSGEIMTWLNSDDVLMPGILNLVANIFSQLNKVKWISGIPTTISDSGLIVNIGHRRTYIRKLIREGLYHGACLGYIMQEGSFWRRSLWMRSGGNVEDVFYSMDFKLWKSFANYADLVSLLTSPAAYRLNPNRKNKNGENYLNEIGVPVPMLMRRLMYPLRFFVHYFLRSTKLSPKIFFNYKDNSWYYHDSGLIDRYLLGRKGKKINNTLFE